MAGGAPAPAPEPDAEKEALREEVARLRGERGRVKGLKAQLERSVAALADQRAAFLKQQVRALPLSTLDFGELLGAWYWTAAGLRHVQLVLPLQPRSA